MRVKNRAERFVVRRFERILERLAAADFVAQAFIDQHVRVHRHTDGQHHAGNAGQGESEAKHRHNAEKHHRVDRQADNGDEAR